MKNTKKTYFILLLLLILAAVMRFWHLSELQYFNIDEELEAFFSQRIFIEKHPVLIGGGFPGGFYTGPLFRYFASIIYAISSFDPTGAAVSASILGVVSVFLIYWAGSLLANRKIALLSAFIYSLSYLIIIYNRTLWAITWAPIVTLLSYISLYKIYKQKQFNYMLILGIAFAMGLNSDPSTFSLMILAIIVMFPIRKYLSRRIILSFLIIISIAIIPVFLFDLRHDFFNMKKAVSLFSGNNNSTTEKIVSDNKASVFSILPLLGQTFSRILIISGPWDIVKQILPCEVLLEQRKDIIPLTLVGAYILLIYFIYRTIKERHFGLSIITGHLLIIIGGVLIYNFMQPGYTHEWFLSVFFPSFCLILAYCVYWGYKKPLLRFPIFFIVMIFTISQGAFLFRGTNSAGMALKKKSVQYAVNELGSGPFYLDVLSSCYAYGGNRYLFRLFKKDPATSYMDYVYSGWLYPKYNGPPPKKGVVFMHFTDPIEAGALDVYENYKKRAIKRQRFGDIEVLIVDDKENISDPPYF